jgi:large subunit ribosomal protein L35
LAGHGWLNPRFVRVVPETVAPPAAGGYGRRFPRFVDRPAKWAAVAICYASLDQETEMPKLKTKSGVKKRFKLTATGKLKHGVAGKRHRLISHNAKYIRQNRGTEVLAEADTARVKLWAPYGLN